MKFSIIIIFMLGFSVFIMDRLSNTASVNYLKKDTISIDSMLEESIKNKKLQEKLYTKDEPDSSSKTQNTKTPIIENIQNHYHFESLNSGLKVIGYFLFFLGFTLLFIYLSKKFNKVYALNSASKKSDNLITKFSNCNLDNYKELIDFNSKIEQQIYENNLLIELNGENHKISIIKYKNDKLQEKIDFIKMILDNKANINQAILTN